MGVSGYGVALNHMRQLAVPSGMRIRAEVLAVRRAGIDLITAVQGEENVDQALQDILAGRNAKIIKKLKAREIKESKIEVNRIADATRQYGLLISNLFQDFYILIKLLKHMKDEGLHASREPKEQDLGKSILAENRKLVAALDPVFTNLADMAPGVANAIKQLE